MANELNKISCGFLPTLLATSYSITARAHLSILYENSTHLQWS